MEPSFLKSICPLLFGLSVNAWVMEARTQEDLVLAGDRVRVRILTPCHVYVFCPNRGAFVKALFVHGRRRPRVARHFQARLETRLETRLERVARHFQARQSTG